jgi:hypothetical protein
MHKLKNYELLRDNLKTTIVYVVYYHLKITWHYMRSPKTNVLAHPVLGRQLTAASTGRIPCCTGCLTGKEVQRGCSVKKMQPAVLAYLVCTG